MKKAILLSLLFVACVFTASARNISVLKEKWPKNKKH